MHITDEQGQRLVIEISKDGGDWEPQAPTDAIVDLFRAATDHDGNKPILTYHGEETIRWRTRPDKRFTVTGCRVYDSNRRTTDNRGYKLHDGLYATLASRDEAQELADLLNENENRITSE